MPNYNLILHKYVMMTSFIKRLNQLNDFKIISNLSGQMIVSFPNAELENVKKILGDICIIEPIFQE